VRSLRGGEGAELINRLEDAYEFNYEQIRRDSSTTIIVLGILLTIVISFFAFCLGGVAHPVIGIFAFIGILGVGIPLALIFAKTVKDRSKERATVEFSFEGTETAARLFHRLLESLDRLGRTRLKYVTGGWAGNWKDSGASLVIQMQPAQLFCEPPDWVSSDFEIFGISVGGQEVYFLPDRILVEENGVFGSIPYKLLSVQAGQTKVIESDSPAEDSVVVGWTWSHPNKDGGPDRRFAFNPQVPICLNGALAITSPHGLHLAIYTSNPEVPKLVFASILELRSYYENQVLTVEPADTTNDQSAPLQIPYQPVEVLEEADWEASPPPVRVQAHAEPSAKARVKCHSCARIFLTKPSNLGKKGKCGKCGQVFRMSAL
jgi:hypothetical protein